MANHIPQTKFPDLQQIDDDRFAAALAKVIRKYRKIKGISRDGLAFQLNLHKNTLYGVETGIKRKSGHFSHTQLTMVNFIKMAAFFGMEKLVAALLAFFSFTSLFSAHPAKA